MNDLRAPEGKLLVVAYEFVAHPRIVGTINPDQLEKFFQFDLGDALFLVFDSGGELVEMAADPMLAKHRIARKTTT